MKLPNLSSLNPWDQPMDVTIKGFRTTYAYGLPTLAYIDLSMNQFIGEIPSRLGDLKVLKTLNVSHSLFTAYSPESLSLLGALESLDVTFNNFSGRTPSTLSNLYSSEILKMRGNNFNGCIPTGGQFATFNNVSSFRPGNLGLSGFPLSSQCALAETLNSSRSYDSSGTSFQDFVSIPALEIGTATGFLSVSLLLILSRSSRFAFFRLLKLPAREHTYERTYGVFRERSYANREPVPQ